MAGGKITRIAIKKSETDVNGNFDGFYKGLTMTAGDNNGFKAKTTNHGKPKKEPKAGKYFVKGWWTNHKDEPIKRAIYGQQLRFHIEMDETYAKPGDVVYFAMFDSDMHTFENDIVKADDPIGLIHLESKKPYTYEKVNSENKVIIKFSTTDNLEQWTQQLDQDKIFELYFRCSYANKGATEHVELPYNFHDYLNLGSIVIDRFKMPGLKPDGSDIADDMTYGTGHPNKKLIYLADRLAKYKEEYKTFGFDMTKHALFADAEDDVLMEPEEIEEVVIINKKQEDYKLEADHATIYRPQFPTPTEQRNALRKVRNKNVKAIYTKEQCYNTKYGVISTGLDVRIFDNLSDEKLFWDFENTAEFYFARGELQENLERMIAKFKRNQGGIYEDEVLTRNIKDHPETIAYCHQVEDYIAEQLKTKLAKLEDVEDKDPYFLVGKDFKNNKGTRDKKNKGFSKPMYSYGNLVEASKGLTIATNDIWSAEVILKEVKFKGDDYTGKYEVTLWDHFGLDLPDMEKKFNIIPSVGEVFVCWFILQHLRGYKPFITKITFTREFTGNINQEKAIRPVENKTNTNDYSIPKYEHGRIM
ncbi:MAG: DUF3289 family protein [Chryseobacterium sp.]|nr:MAG: DUF3289 family protein [Chryseobacterium sp.]